MTRDPDSGVSGMAARLSPEGFHAEQAILGRCWTFLGFEHQVAKPNDWFRTILGGRSIIVQRFGDGISAFENKCAHRGFPLRQTDKGNGALVCGFHHWRYNAEGLALGIPECPAMFGTTPRELNARLNRVELAFCGSMMFARFAGGAEISLEAWLGDAYPILSHISGYMERDSGKLECEVKANWRYVKEISLDDYHIVAVHPATFGKAGYIPADSTHYTRIGAHSAYFRGGNAESLPRMVRQCQEGTFFPKRYRILQLFPTLIVTFVHALNYLGEGYWYTIVLRVIPEAHDRTRTVSRYFKVPHPPTSSGLRDGLRKLAWPSVNAGFRFYARRVHAEDNEACEALQAHARLDDPTPYLAKQEERVGWFDDSYRRIIAGETVRP